MKTLITFLSLLTCIYGQAQVTQNRSLVLSSFADENELKNWVVFTDQVMSDGEYSDATLDVSSDSFGVFKGMLKLDGIPGKGFATIRKSGNWDFSSFDKVMIDTEGDDRTYTLTLKDKNTLQSGVTFQADFKALSGLSVTAIGYKKFRPFFRGQILDNSIRIDLKNVREIGLMIKDDVAKDFELKIDSFWIE